MSTDSKLNYYEILQVPQNVSEHDIKIAYEKAKQTYSPLNTSLYSIFTEEEAKELRALTEQAYTILSNSVYRNLYDRRLYSKDSNPQELEFDSIIKACESLFKDQDSKIVEVHKFKKPDLDKYDVNPELEEEFKNCISWNGPLLKKVREYKKISVEKMHELTKVNSWYITAVENMDPSNLPATVFVRGYVVQLAKTLALNEKTVADSYMKAFKQKIEQHKESNK